MKLVSNVCEVIVCILYSYRAWAALEISFRGGRAGQARGQGGQAYDGAYMRFDFTEDQQHTK